MNTLNLLVLDDNNEVVAVHRNASYALESFFTSSGVATMRVTEESLSDLLNVGLTGYDYVL